MKSKGKTKGKAKKPDRGEQGKRQTCVTHKFTALFPAIFEKAEFDDGKEEYGITMLFPKKVDLGKAAKGEKYSLEEIVHNAAVAEWGEEDEWPEGVVLPFRDGDTDKNKKGDPTYKGKIFVRAKNKNRRPGFVDLAGDNITDPEEIYAGCICRAQVYAFAYDTSGNKGVSLILHNVQKIEDGEHIGGVFQAPAEAFSAFGSDDEDDDEEEKPVKKGKKKAEPEDDDEDEKPKKSKQKPSKKKPEPEPEDDDEDDEDDDEDDDEELIDDEDDIPPPPPKKKKK